MSLGYNPQLYIAPDFSGLVIRSITDAGKEYRSAKIEANSEDFNMLYYYNNRELNKVPPYKERVNLVYNVLAGMSLRNNNSDTALIRIQIYKFGAVGTTFEIRVNWRSNYQTTGVAYLLQALSCGALYTNTVANFIVDESAGTKYEFNKETDTFMVDFTQSTSVNIAILMNCKDSYGNMHDVFASLMCSEVKRIINTVGGKFVQEVPPTMVFKDTLNKDTVVAIFDNIADRIYGTPTIYRTKLFSVDEIATLWSSGKIRKEELKD